jgi:uncharacterized protein
MRSALWAFVVCNAFAGTVAGQGNGPNKTASQSMNPVVAFEIPVVDMTRAMAFYKAVFDVDFTQDTVDGLQMAFFPLTQGAGGASGALVLGDTYVPAVNGTRVYFYTPDIAKTFAKALAAGGQALYPITDVGEFGWVAEVMDAEGKRIAFSQPPAKSP